MEIKPNKIKILHLEDLSSDAELVERELVKGGISFEKIVVDNKVDFEKALDDFLPDIILSDHSLPSFDSIQALKIVKYKKINIPFILITSTMTDELAVSIMMEGASDYILKDRLSRLPVAIFNSLEKYQLEKEKQEYLKKIEQNEKRFRAIIEKGKDMILLTSEDAKILYGSPSITKFFGYAQEEVTQLVSLTFIHPEDIAEYLVKRSKLLLTPGESFYHQLRLKHKNGAWIWCEFNVTNLLKEPGIKAFVLNFRDISEKKVREQQERFDQNNLSALINSTKDLMWSIDRDFNLITSNEPFNEMTKQNFGKVIEKGENVLATSQSVEMSKQFKKSYERAFAGEVFTQIGHFNFEFEFWSEISYYPIRNENEIIGTACYSRDITERIIAERKLRESESFNKGVLNSLKSHIAVVDKAGNIMAVNDAWNQFSIENGNTPLLGIGVGVNYFEICEKAMKVNSLLASDALQGMKNVLNGNEKNFYLEYPCHSQTQKRWFGMHVVKFDSEELRIVVSHQNISQRVEAEQKLKESEALLKEAQALAVIGSWQVDLVTGVHTWSDEFYKLFGFINNDEKPSRELFLSVIHPDDLAFVINKIKQSSRSFQNSSFDFRFFQKDGSMHYGFSEYLFELDNFGKPFRLYGFVQDRTEIKMAEQEILKQSDLLRDLSNHLQKIREEERKNVAREIHDELGQQLTALKMDIDWVLHKQKGADEKVVFKLNEMLKMNDGIINTVRRISSSLRPALLDDLGLIATIEWQCSDFEEKFGIPCNFISTVKERYFSKDFSINVYRILQETLTNVSRHAQAKNVTVHFTEGEKGIVLQITDDGKGINKKDISNTKRLGLLGMKERAILLGGNLTIEQGVKGGTIINLSLPASTNYNL